MLHIFQLINLGELYHIVRSYIDLLERDTDHHSIFKIPGSTVLAQQVKAPVAKFDGLSLTPGTHMVEGENKLQHIVFLPPVVW